MMLLQAEEFFEKISTHKEGRYGLVGQLVKEFLTIHNSSRDFSIQVCTSLVLKLGHITYCPCHYRTVCWLSQGEVVLVKSDSV